MYDEKRLCTIVVRDISLDSQFTLCSRKKICDYYATTQLANHIQFHNSCVHILCYVSCIARNLM